MGLLDFLKKKKKVSKSFTCEIISESISVEKQIYSFQKELIEKQKLKNKI